MSDKLNFSLNQALANSFEMYARAHGMHWNVEGNQFPLYHEFFATIYAEVYGAIDALAEEIRACGFYVGYGTKHFSDTNVLPDTKQITGTNINAMLSELDMSNEMVLKSLSAAFDLAQKGNHQGLMNFLADRIDAHKKHSWMIKSCLKQ